MSKVVRVFMGIPSMGNRCDSQTYALRDLERKYAGRVELVYPKDCVHRMFHDFARNAIVEDFLASDCDILWFLDSDICPPTHILDLITEHGDKWEAAGACYPIFMVPPGQKYPSILFTAYKGVVEGQGIGLTAVPRTGQEFVDGLATGCMMLKRSVFAKLQKPYFAFKYDEESRRMTEGEDLSFCLKVNQQGIKFFTDYGMVCKHYKTVCLLDINNYATDMANDKFLAYEAEIRPQVIALAKQVEALKQQQAPKSKIFIPGR